MMPLPAQTEVSSLIAFGEEARSILMGYEYAGLASRLGYALAYDSPLAAALETDFVSAVASPITVAKGAYLPPAIAVKYFSPNTAGLFAVVEFPVPIAYKAAVLLALIVAGKGEEKHITVEGISSVAT